MRFDMPLIDYIHYHLSRPILSLSLPDSSVQLFQLCPTQDGLAFLHPTGPNI